MNNFTRGREGPRGPVVRYKTADTLVGAELRSEGVGRGSLRAGLVRALLYLTTGSRGRSRQQSDGKDDADDRAFGRLRAQRQFAVMRFHNSMHDRQAQPGAGALGRFQQRREGTLPLFL